MKFHIFIAIDSKNYDPGLLTRISDMYSTLGKIHVCIMGSKTKDLLPLLPTGSIETLVDITAPTFNYAYATNRCVRAACAKSNIRDDGETIVLTDSWSVVSLIQMEQQIRSTNFQTSFLLSDIYRDCVEQPLNKNSKKIMLSIFGRLKTSKDSKIPPAQKLIPVPVLSLMQFKKAGGLEEKMFTDVSRLYMMEFLEKNGMKRILSSREGIRLSYDPVYSEIDTKRDVEIYNSLKNTGERKVMIQANPGYDWGDPTRLKFLKVESNIPIWTEGIIQQQSNILLVRKPTEKQKTKTEIEKPVLLPKRAKVPISGFESTFQSSMLVVKNDVRDVCLSSNILKKLYLDFGPVTIFTDRKSFPAISLLDSFMVSEIIDLSAYQSKPVDFSKYKKIYKMEGFTKSIQIPNAEEITELKEHNPFCCTPSPYKQIPDNSVCFIMSAKPEGYRRTQEDMWKLLSKIPNKIIGYNIPIFLLGMEQEKNILETISMKNIGQQNRKVSISVNQNLIEASSIINFCKLIISTPHSSATWLSYAQKKNTILIHDKKEQIPDVDWFSFVNYNEDRLVEKIIKMVVENS